MGLDRYLVRGGYAINDSDLKMICINRSDNNLWHYYSLRSVAIGTITCQLFIVSPFGLLPLETGINNMQLVTVVHINYKF